VGTEELRWSFRVEGMSVELRDMTVEEREMDGCERYLGGGISRI
jgi:hypothetical protein